MYEMYSQQLNSKFSNKHEEINSKTHVNFYALNILCSAQHNHKIIKYVVSKDERKICSDFMLLLGSGRI
jgi:hypothetical protein